MTLEKKSEFARRQGVSGARVSQWIAAGLVVVSEGRVDIEASEAKLSLYRDKTDGRAKKSAALKPGKVKRAKSLKPPKARDGETPEQAADRILSESGAAMSFEEAKRVKENYLALLNQLEYDQKSGAVVAVAEIVRTVGDEYARVRTRLLSIPAERAPEVHRLKTVAEVQDALHGAIVQALEELTHDGTRSAR
jgi:hypothetical protein